MGGGERAAATFVDMADDAVDDFGVGEDRNVHLQAEEERGERAGLELRGQLSSEDRSRSVTRKGFLSSMMALTRS